MMMMMMMMMMMIMMIFMIIIIIINLITYHHHSYLKRELNQGYNHNGSQNCKKGKETGLLKIIFELFSFFLVVLFKISFSWAR